MVAGLRAAMVDHIQVPCLGVKVEAWDAAGHPVDGTGDLVITVAMPSMPLYFWGDDDGSRYRESYFHVYPGVWRHGDYIEIGERGIVIRGRSDSTLNRNGIRLGSADIYAVVEALPEVAEALVVGAEIGAEGYYMPLFRIGSRREQRGADTGGQSRLPLRPGPVARGRCRSA